MANANPQNLRDQILDAAEELFSEKGYAGTSIEEIIEKAGCSKSTFYHYFDSKDEVSSAPDMFDRRYTVWYEKVKDKGLSSLELLRELTEVFLQCNEEIYDMDRAIAICRHQLSKKGVDYMSGLRPYNRIIRTIMQEGQKKGEIRSDISFVELSKILSLAHRGMLFDWCMSGGTYSFREFGIRSMDVLLEGFRAKDQE